MEMTRRQNRPIYAGFIDLKAAYDTVNREALWKLILDYGLPAKECKLIQSLYQGTSAAVRCEGGLTDWFEVKTGLRQGCLLSPALFNIFIDFVVRRALAGKYNHGVEIRYRLPDGRKDRGIRSKVKTSLTHYFTPTTSSSYTRPKEVSKNA